MSASTLLIDGKINPSLIPASVIPTNPVFQSVAIEPATGAGVMNIENPAGDSFSITKGVDGVTRMFQTPAGATANLVFLADAPGNTVVISAGTIELGDATDATPTVQIIGTTGLGQVYDKLYNPVVRNYTAYPPLDISTTAGQQTITINPAATGLYNLCFSLSFINASTIGNGVLEWYLTVPGGGEVFGGSNTIVPTDFVLPSGSGGASGPLDWTYNQFVYLTGGETYTFTITPWGTGWGAVAGLLQTTFIG